MVATGLATVGERTDVLEFVDQALFLGLRATGQAAAVQAVWVYRRPVNLAEVRRFHGDLGYSLAGRLIEPSALPFGRHRWVAAPDAAAPLHVADQPRDPAALSDWLDERANLPIDPEFGPGWHVGVLPMTDGSTAVTFVASHCLLDGGAAILSIVEAVRGRRRDLGYAPPRSRTRTRALTTDARRTLGDTAVVARAAAAAVRYLAAKRRESTAGPRTPKPTVTDPHRPVVAPAVSVTVDLAEWDSRAAELGGNGHSLLAGFAARLAVRQGRKLTPEGRVPLLVPISERTPEDTRANAVVLVNITVDPGGVVDDLSDTRRAIRDGLKAMRENPDEALALLPLTPFVPRRAVRATADLAFGFGTQPVSCSNVGDVPIEFACPDGSPADRVLLRGVDQHVTREVLEHRHGLLTLVSGRVNGTVTTTVVAYQPGIVNTKPELRQRVMATLAEFGLTGDVI